jgi:hypothetical protein
MTLSLAVTLVTAALTPRHSGAIAQRHARAIPDDVGALARGAARLLLAGDALMPHSLAGPSVVMR